MTNKPSPLPALTALTPGPALQVRFKIRFGVTGRAYQCPSFQLAPGMTVTLFPHNDAGVNANACHIADRASLLGTNSARVLPAGPDVSLGYQCNNTGEIWASGTAGDGVLVQIGLNAVG